MKKKICRTSSQSDPNRAKYGAFVKAATPNWDFARDPVWKASSKTQTTQSSTSLSRLIDILKTQQHNYINSNSANQFVKIGFI